MAIHLLTRHDRRASVDFADALGRQLLRIDAILLGAVVIAIVMVGGLFVLKDDPGVMRDCRVETVREARFGLPQQMDERLRAGPGPCRLRATRLRASA